MAQREGYLLIDHSASPGLPEDLAMALGFDPDWVKEGKKFEVATLTCKHCKTTVFKNAKRTRPREMCMKCGGNYICDGCAYEASLPGYSHTPFDKKVDWMKEAEAKGIPILGSPATLLQPPKG